MSEASLAVQRLARELVRIEADHRVRLLTAAKACTDVASIWLVRHHHGAII